MEEAAKVIGNFQPDELNYESIEKGLNALAEAHGLIPQLDLTIREPVHNAAVLSDGDVLGWHTDNDGVPGLILLWSSVAPTEVQFADGTELRAQDGDVILIENSLVRHKQPNDKRPRWFARINVYLGGTG